MFHWFQVLFQCGWIYWLILALHSPKFIYNYYAVYFRYVKWYDMNWYDMIWYNIICMIFTMISCYIHTAYILTATNIFVSKNAPKTRHDLPAKAFAFAQAVSHAAAPWWKTSWTMQWHVVATGGSSSRWGRGGRFLRRFAWRFSSNGTWKGGGRNFPLQVWKFPLFRNRHFFGCELLVLGSVSYEY